MDSGVYIFACNNLLIEGEITYVDSVCGSFIFFCGNNFHTCKMRNKKDRFDCGDGDKNDSCPFYVFYYGHNSGFYFRNIGNKH